jgi:hypothetical protein
LPPDSNKDQTQRPSGHVAEGRYCDQINGRLRVGLRALLAGGGSAPSRPAPPHLHPEHVGSAMLQRQQLVDPDTLCETTVAS